MFESKMIPATPVPATIMRKCGRYIAFVEKTAGDPSGSVASVSVATLIQSVFNSKINDDMK